MTAVTHMDTNNLHAWVAIMLFALHHIFPFTAVITSHFAFICLDLSICDTLT